ncbi:hypothetical protein AAJP84_06710 [Bartonella schoenbuchensis]
MLRQRIVQGLASSGGVVGLIVRLIQLCVMVGKMGRGGVIGGGGVS